MGNKKVGKTLKKARKGLGLKQSDVAKKAGITSNYYAMIERDEIDSPGSKVMTEIAKVLKLQLFDVFSL